MTGTVSFPTGSIPAAAVVGGGGGGAQGPQGPQGPQGIQGPAGTAGAAGAAGAQGIQGPAGNDGAAGAAGAAGAQGIQGVKGDTGAAGAAGAAGAQGIQGVKGDTGAAGAAGGQGIQGVKGDTGAAGAQGIQGNAGTNGTNGTNGVFDSNTIPALAAGAAVAAADLLIVSQSATAVKSTAQQVKDWCSKSPQFTGGGAAAGSWPTLAHAALLTVAAADTIENDGAAWYHTLDTTNGRAQDCVQNIFRLTADAGAPIGSAIADYFGANSAFPTVVNAIYELEYWLWFTKTTAGTVTWTLTNTQAYTNLAAEWHMCPVGGIGTAGTMATAGIDNTTTAAAALPASASLTLSTQQFCHIRAIAEVGTAGNIRLRVTSSAGTITPRRGSYYTARRISAGNVGAFVA